MKKSTGLKNMENKRHEFRTWSRSVGSLKIGHEGKKRQKVFISTEIDVDGQGPYRFKSCLRRMMRLNPTSTAGLSKISEYL